MGVHGLWKLLEAAGKPVPLETLENKVLAVDVSIWLHQMMKGFQDSRGAPVPHAHLLGLFHRVCKLLYYRIKPVFVFDGGVPLLKKQTIAARKNLKKLASQSAAEAKEKLLRNLVRRKAVRQILDGNSSKVVDGVHDDGSAQNDMFHLPPIPTENFSNSEDESHSGLQVLIESSEEDSEPETKPNSQYVHGFKLDLHSIDVHSEEFCSLPPDVRHDILSELKETRKQNSWGRLHEMPEESGEFSNYQLGRLIKRRNVQVSLEKAEKEMGGKVLRMTELQELMTAQGVNIVEESGLTDSKSQRIASDNTTRYILCKDIAPEAGSSFTPETSGSSYELEKEQTEFISKMAANMLEQMSKKKQGKTVKIKENQQSLASLREDLIEDEPNKILDELEADSNVTDISSGPNKILADSWSSDEDFETRVVNREKSSTSKQGWHSDTSENKYLIKKTKSLSETFRSDSVGCAAQGKSNDMDVDVSIANFPRSDTSKGNSASESDSEGGKKSVNENKSVDSLINMAFEKGRKENQTVSTRPLSDSSSVKCSKVDKIDDKESHSSGKKTPLEIIIHPDEKPSDDIFSDIFSCPGQVISLQSTNLNESRIEENRSEKLLIQEQTLSDCEIRSKESYLEKKPIEVVICPTGKPDEDDIFADIFTNPTCEKSSTLSVGEHNVIKECVDDIKKEDDGEFSESDVEEVPSINECINKPAVDDINKTESDAVFASLFQNPSTSSANWNEMKASLEAEQQELQKERGRQERLAASITDQMCVEAQELLQLFGLPFIVAPMEAEAQCAFLDIVSLTEGSITDDSDIWLFGGRKVYKNFFNQKKHVLQFTSSNINHYYKLSREQLVQLALLVGSDYTTGIQGVGPVTALEIVAAFHGRSESDPVQCVVKGLSEFKDWWNTGRPHKSNRIRMLDKKLKNVKFAEGFPSQAVVEAYLRPSVDNSQETLSWGGLDLPALREYARSKFGWTASKTDEILLPVEKRWNDRTSQRTIDSYFNFQPHLVEGMNKMSKRVLKAVSLMGAEELDSEDADDPEPDPNRNKVGKRKLPIPKEKVVKKRKVKNGNEMTDSSMKDSGIERQTNSVLKSSIQAERKPKKARTEELPVRAPIVPRERTSTGVKRVGVKSIKNLNLKETRENSAPASQTISNPVAERGSHHTKETILSTANVMKSSMRKMSDLPATISCPDSVAENEASLLSDPDLVNPKASGSGIRNHTKNAPKNVPSESSSSDTETDVTKIDLSELAGLTDVNWEDDPWSSRTQEKEERSPQKLYFGGIRPNRPKKPARGRPPIQVGTRDERGLRPGWVTEERLQSRGSALVDAVPSRKSVPIPQRERDQKAREEAKLKAISVMKAAESNHASRLLGGKVSKRGRKRRRPGGKVIPEHNLSESSSDD